MNERLAQKDLTGLLDGLFGPEDASASESAEIQFKTCPCCGASWPTRESFLADSYLRVDGYQSDFELLEEGLFFFTHCTDCYSTMSVPAREFADLYTGPRYTERKTLTSECPRYCIDKEQLARCDAYCECAFVREVLHIVKNRLDEARTSPASEV